MSILALDIETTGLEYDADLLGIAYYSNAEKGFIKISNLKSIESIIDRYDEVVFHNAYFDVPRLHRYGIHISKHINDTMLLSYVDKPNRQSHSLAYWGEQLGYPKLDYDHNAEVDWNVLEEYAIRDVEITYKVYQTLKHYRDNFIYKLECDVMLEVIAMYKNGICIDKDQALKLRNTLEAKICKTKAELQDMVGTIPGKTTDYKTKPNFTHVLDFNPSSNDHKAFVLQRMGWVPENFTPTGKPKIDKITMEYLSVASNDSRIRELTKLCLIYSEYSKINGTFVQAILDAPEKDILRGELKQTGTITGRFSSKNPNLQNLPVRSELGQQVRSCIVAPEGYKLLDFDLSGIEARILAHYLKVATGDSTLCDALTAGLDIHDTNAEAWQVSRNEAKTLLYAILYGAGPAKIGDGDFKKGKELLDRVHKGMPSIKQFQDFFWEQLSGRPDGSFKTKFGRILYYPDIHNRVKWIREKARRQSFNALLQGTAADIMKIIIAELLPELRINGAITHVTVHDEVLLSIPVLQEQQICDIIKEYFNRKEFLDCPVTYDLVIGNTWSEVH